MFQQKRGGACKVVGVAGQTMAALEEEDDKPKEIFISYGREPEVIAFVAKLKRDLEGNGFSVWLDLKASW